MPFRTKHSYSAPGAGTVVIGKKGAKTFSGRGKAPAGTRKVAPATVKAAPIVTISPSGKVSSQNFPSRKAATKAEQRAQDARHVLAVLMSKRQTRNQRSKAPMVAHVPSTPVAKPIASHTSAPAKASTPKLKGTPEQRQRVRHKLQGAKQTLHHTPALEGPLQPDQRKFDEVVAKKTKLNPRTIGAQSLAEESAGAAAQRQAEGNQNWLNIGPGAQLAPTPKGAAKETAQLINTGPSYGGIRASRGRGAKAQVAAIAASPWGTVGSTMAGTLPLVSTSAAKRQAAQRVSALTAKAKGLGMKTAGVGQGNVGPAPKKVVTRFKAAKRAMKEVEGLPYVWGGGHGSPTSSPTGGGLDCSGAVGYVLNKIGALHGSLTSGSMGSVLKPGPGALTVFYNGEHTFLRLGNEYWGTSVGDSGSGGLGPHPTPSASYLAQYNVGHVPGLGRKQALQLGFKPGAVSSFPGMTLSSSGTTATINPGAGTTQGKPGFSKSPIRLTPFQKLQHFRTRKAAAEGEEATLSSPKGTALADLERKYGRAT